MKKAVIDASTLIAFVKGEEGKEEARKWLPSSKISAVNYAEVLLKLGIDSEDVRLIKAIVRNMDVEVVPYDRIHAEAVATLKPLRSAELSMADLSCLALGRMTGLPIITSEHHWDSLDLGLEIILFRKTR